MDILLDFLLEITWEHVPSIPEFLNSGMLVGVDTSLYLWGVVSYDQ